MDDDYKVALMAMVVLERDIAFALPGVPSPPCIGGQVSGTISGSVTG
jgi:hypothetical protein